MNIYLQTIKNLSFENKYTRWYINIITKGIERAKTIKEAKNLLGYIEQHHILPKSFNMGGEKDIENVVFLTAKEHFIIHMMLPKMLQKTLFRQKMTWAIVSMLGQSKKGNKNYVSSLTYETAKKIFNKNNIERPDSAKSLKVFRVKDKHGNIIEIDNMPKFCKENNLSRDMMRLVSRGINSYHKGYYAINHEEPIREFKDDKGNHYKMTLDELKVFCKEHNLIYNTMRRLTLNVVKQHKQFSCLIDSEIRRTIKQHKLITPEGEVIIIDDLPKFCLENNFNYSTFRCVSNGTTKKSKEGYRKYIENDYISNLS